MSPEPMKPCLWVAFLWWGVWFRPWALRVDRYDHPLFGFGLSEMFVEAK